MTRFARSAITSIFTTSLDFALLAALVELAGLGHPLATFLGTLVGSTSNFLINRSWAFRAGEGRAGAQAVRYVLVQLGSAYTRSACGGSPTSAACATSWRR